MKFATLAPPAILLCVTLAASAQQAVETSYSRRNTFSALVEYSNDSSHIILGTAENRKIAALGFQYQRRLLHRSLLDLSYTAEFRPGMVESDPVLTETIIETSPDPEIVQQTPVAVVRCQAATSHYSNILQSASGPVLFSGEFVDTCSRRQVVEQGLSPAGLRINLFPHHRIQPTFSTFAGYMFSSQQVPIPDSGSFNYTFEFGGGFEFFRTPTRSARLEYQVQHFSNKKTADFNPGVDSGFVKLTYAFGR